MFHPYRLTKPFYMKLFLTYAVLVFSLLSCKKDHSNADQLPSATQTGENTFGCKINGTIFLPGGTGLAQSLKVQYDPTPGAGLSISAKKVLSGSQSAYVTLLGVNISAAGNYPLSLSSNYRVSYTDGANCGFQTEQDVPESGVLNITRFDTQTRVVSGTFSFKGTTQSCGTVEATDGRFDVKY